MVGEYHISDPVTDIGGLGPSGILGSALLLGLKFQPRLQGGNSSTNMQFHGHTYHVSSKWGVKVWGKGQYIAKMWPRSKIFQVFQNFTKITKYAKNDEMHIFPPEF